MFLKAPQEAENTELHNESLPSHSTACFQQLLGFVLPLQTTLLVTRVLRGTFLFSCDILPLGVSFEASGLSSKRPPGWPDHRKESRTGDCSLQIRERLSLAWTEGLLSPKRERAGGVHASQGPYHTAESHVFSRFGGKDVSVPDGG